MEYSQLQPVPCFIGENKEKIKQNKRILLNYKNKSYSLEISLSEKNIIFSIQEKYDLYRYESIFSFQAFQDLHKYFRLFDDLNEIYNDLIKSNIGIKSDENEQAKLILFLNVNINKNNHEINIILNKRELDKYKDIDIIMSNYLEMKKELDELKQKYLVNSNLFGDSKWLNNNKYINLIKAGIRHQLNKDIIGTSLIYRCSKDGDDCSIFHQKCDGISNTLVIGESESNKIFGGFTSQSWVQENETKYDDNAFLFQLNRMEIHYVIKGKGGTTCHKEFGPTFGNWSLFNLCFQDRGKSLEEKNREDSYNENTNSFENSSKQNYIYEGSNKFKLKDFEVFQLNLN